MVDCRGGGAPILQINMNYYYSFNGSPKYRSPITIIFDVIIIDNQPSRAKIIIIDNPSRVIIIDNQPSRAKSIIINNQPSQFEQLLLTINRAEPRVLLLTINRANSSNYY
jgi:hypothetical protein